MTFSGDPGDFCKKGLGKSLVGEFLRCGKPYGPWIAAFCNLSEDCLIRNSFGCNYAYFVRCFHVIQTTDLGRCNGSKQIMIGKFLQRGHAQLYIFIVVIYHDSPQKVLVIKPLHCNSKRGLVIDPKQGEPIQCSCAHIEVIVIQDDSQQKVLARKSEVFYRMFTYTPITVFPFWPEKIKKFHAFSFVVLVQRKSYSTQSKTQE